MTPNGPSWELIFGAGYIVPPCQGLDVEETEANIVGSHFELETFPAEYFLPIFSKQADEYPIEIGFSPQNGEQENEVRRLVRTIALAAHEEKAAASKNLAVFLAQATTRRSKKPGLLVALAGRKENNHRVVLWKFPADESIQAHVSDGGIVIRLIQDAFSGNSTYLKVAMFEGTAAATSFWRGRIEDRQTKSRIREMADFWVINFLRSRPAMTDTRGTRLLAKALRSVVNRMEDVESQQALVDAANVIQGQTGRNISLDDFAQTYLPPVIRPAFIRAVGGPEMTREIFRLDRETLERELKYKSIALDNQFVIRGPLEQFDDVVQIKETAEEDVVELTLTGRITSQVIKTR